MDAYIAGQILGFVSYGLGIATFYQKNDKRLKILMLALNSPKKSFYATC